MKCLFCGKVSFKADPRTKYCDRKCANEAKIDFLIGKRFGRLTVLKKIDTYRVLCLCSCGNKKSTYRAYLKSGTVKSCGCLAKDSRKERAKHNLCNTRIYSIWKGMMARCYNKNNLNYLNYGGRGILVYNEWHDIVKFCRYMGHPPSKKHSIDRINNNKGYFPGNCRWVTEKVQHNNKRSNISISYKKETLTLKQWSEKLGINYDTLRYRIVRKNWPVPLALSLKPSIAESSRILDKYRKKENAL